MTLIVVIPTVAGLVVAADSRLTLYDPNWIVACDNVFKISEVESVDRTVVFTTGYATVWALGGVQVDKVCEHVATAKPKFDAQALLVKAAQRPGASLPDIAQEVAGATGNYIASHPADYAGRLGQFLFQAAIARFDPNAGKAIIGSFSVNFNADASISADKLEVEYFLPNDGCQAKLFGEANYLTNAVFNGPGLQFLTERYGRFRDSIGAAIEHADPELASNFAVDLIEAASRTTSIVPSATGIGGPVDVVLVGEAARPKRLQWKST